MIVWVNILELLNSGQTLLDRCTTASPSLRGVTVNFIAPSTVAIDTPQDPFSTAFDPPGGDFHFKPSTHKQTSTSSYFRTSVTTQVHEIRCPKSTQVETSSLDYQGKSVKRSISDSISYDDQQQTLGFDTGHDNVLDNLFQDFGVSWWSVSDGRFGGK